jgi:hypothetical protein
VLEALIEATYTKERLQHLRRSNLALPAIRFNVIPVHPLSAPLAFPSTPFAKITIAPESPDLALAGSGWMSEISSRCAT